MFFQNARVKFNYLLELLFNAFTFNENFLFGIIRIVLYLKLNIIVFQLSPLVAPTFYSICIFRQTESNRSTCLIKLHLKCNNYYLYRVSFPYTVTLCNIAKRRSDLILHGFQRIYIFVASFVPPVFASHVWGHSIRVVFTHCILLHAHACTLCIGITLTRLALKGGGHLHETFRPSLKARTRESWLDQMQNKLVSPGFLPWLIVKIVFSTVCTLF